MKNIIKKIPGTVPTYKFIVDTAPVVKSRIKKATAKALAGFIQKQFNLLSLEEKARTLGALKVYGRLEYGDEHIKTRMINAMTFFRNRIYRKESIVFKWLEANAKDGDVFYDIGANIGAYSLMIGSTKRARAIYSFEPGVFTFPLLCENILVNNLSDVAHPFCIALSNETGLVDFHYSTIEPGGANHFAGEDVCGVGAKTALQGAFTQERIRLDDFVGIWGMESPNVLKIDVDGIEYEVIEGGKEILSGVGPRVLIVEINEDPLYAKRKKMIHDLLISVGFELREKENKPEIQNYLYMKKDA